jgi:hypothetical protein
MKEGTQQSALFFIALGSGKISGTHQGNIRVVMEC